MGKFYHFNLKFVRILKNLLSGCTGACLFSALFVSTNICVLFFSAQNQSENSTKTGRKLGNQVIRKGYMCIHNLGIMKGGSRDYWFVLTSESISWFKDEEVSLNLCFYVYVLSFVIAMNT